VADFSEMPSVATEQLVGLWSSFQGSGLPSVWAFWERILGQDREEFLIDPLAQFAGAGAANGTAKLQSGGDAAGETDLSQGYPALSGRF
jgi:hypothetical protein